MRFRRRFKKHPGIPAKLIGWVEAGELTAPITSARLVGGELVIVANAHCRKNPGGPVHLRLFGEDEILVHTKEDPLDLPMTSSADSLELTWRIKMLEKAVVEE